jgi:hypothetical protein
LEEKRNGTHPYAKFIQDPYFNQRLMMETLFVPDDLDSH